MLYSSVIYFIVELATVMPDILWDLIPSSGKGAEKPRQLIREETDGWGRGEERF